ncbi:MAG: arylsulfatase [Thermoguttaceae bacterium]|nr:arylsulfatase [Thermoguttaceae bacterium]
MQQTVWAAIQIINITFGGLVLCTYSTEPIDAMGASSVQGGPFSPETLFEPKALSGPEMLYVSVPPFRPKTASGPETPLGLESAWSLRPPAGRQPLSDSQISFASKSPFSQKGLFGPETLCGAVPPFHPKTASGPNPSSSPKLPWVLQFSSVSELPSDPVPSSGSKIPSALGLASDSEKPSGGQSAFSPKASSGVGEPRPNILLILADDLGYGDLGCYNPQGKIPTPHLDRLARLGMRFTDAHSPSSVCTPSRYALLTGRYCWRSRLQCGVLGGLSPPLISPERFTLPALLQKAGYHTACIGKWHLGLTWPRKPNTPPFTDRIENGPEGWNVDYSKPIGQGPLTVGFDEFYGIAGSPDMVPYTFIHNDRVEVPPTVDKAFPMMLGRSAMTRRGPAAAQFEAVEILSVLTRKSLEYIQCRAPEARTGKPFFLYLALNSPHTPILPSEPWQGRSGLNPYADFVMQTDDCVGQILAALEKHGLAENTLVIFTSDNGPSPQADFATLRAKGHDPAGGLRGAKADLWEGGHRVPLLVCWPGRVPAGSCSNQLVSLVDLMATCAELVGQNLPDHAAEDSLSFRPLLLGKATGPVRDSLIMHSITGKFAIRQGAWKLLLTPGSGGWSSPRDPEAYREGLPEVQLYNLAEDPAEQKNLQAQHPEIVKQLLKLLEQQVAEGRTRPGPPVKNDVPIDIWKRPTPSAKP